MKIELYQPQSVGRRQFQPRCRTREAFGARAFCAALVFEPASTVGAAKESAAGRRTPNASRASQQGIALVITLILLSVITFMAIAFLVISRGEKSSVGTQTDQIIANQASTAALERSLAELVAHMTITTNEFNYDLTVPTNYSNPIGFIPGLVSPTNVNLDFKFGGSTNFTANEWEQDLANELMDPRPPVFVTNRLRGGLDFRYYLDLNRNGVFDPTGWMFSTNNLGLQESTNVNFYTGDPQWIGGLEFPDRHHGPDNLFTYRYTYFVVPASKTLDINYMYNDAKAQASPTMSTANDGFFRNMGAGTYELNLASFLVDLNTNFWFPPGVGPNPYTYYWQPLGFPNPYTIPNKGVAFEDALSILGYRYSYSTGTLFSVASLFGGPNGAGARAFGSDLVDDYSAGPPMISTSWQPPGGDADLSRTIHGWSGAPNTNHIFSISELFDKTKIHHLPYNPGDTTWTFPDRIAAAGTNIGTYNRYTGYRLLSQLGTDSAPEPGGTINLNYDNIVQRNNQGIASATNFFQWQPADFLNVAALRLLTNAGYVVGSGPIGASPTNIVVNNGGNLQFQIQVYPTNLYSSSIHRLLQLAANVYDATTNRSYNKVFATNGFPTVFRPVFANVRGRGVFITGYIELTNQDVFITGPTPPMRDPYNASDMAQTQPLDMVAGVPMIVGARKGFPNFNELAMQTEISVTRKLEFIRGGGGPNGDPNAPLSATNQLYLMSVSNTVGVEAWNSYRAPYPRNLTMLARLDTTASLSPTNDFSTATLVSTNSGPAVPFITHFSNIVTVPLIPQQTWNGFVDGTPINSFLAPIAPVTNHYSFLPQASLFGDILQVPYRTNFFALRTPTNWFLRLDTRLYFILYDRDARRIVDFVNLISRPDPLYINQALYEDAPGAGRPNYSPDSLAGSMWLTNQYGSSPALTYGIVHQIQLSLWTNVTTYSWNEPNSGFAAGWNLGGAVNFFRTNLMRWGAAPNAPGPLVGPLYLTNHFFAPYAPSRTIYLNTSWQANDPLVHYTVGDLTVMHTNSFTVDNTNYSTMSNIRAVNGRYEPWGGYISGPANSPTKYLMAVKDSQVGPRGAYGHSDDWDFPTNKFPNVGWLGRVHRGTPWQTVYLKSPNIDEPTWLSWSGNPLIVTNFGQFPTNFVPLYTTNLNFVTFYSTPLGLLPDYAIPDGILTFPTNDWALLDIFSTSFNDNSGLGKLNINQTNLASWSAVLGGVIVITNGAPGALAIPPAGVYDLSNPNLPVPPMVQIVNGINQARVTVITNRAGVPVYLTNWNKAFQHLGELMAVPQLTVQSPFLNTNGLPGAPPLITDAQYERIPQQILGLLKCDHTPRFVIYAYGQALKPAEHSYVTSGQFAGLYTNYQVTAESAIRAVVRIDGAPSKPHAVVESYNVLPPD